MDRIEAKDMIRTKLQEFEAEYLTDRSCPKCGVESTMIGIKVWMEDEFIKKWRCLNCLSLFVEGLQEVDG